MELLVSLLSFSAPVGIAATGESIGQKAGVLNIGLEGMMLTGAFSGVVVALQTGNPWLGLAAAIFATAALGLIQAFFVLKLAADQVVVGTAVNLLSLGVTSSLYRAMFGASGQLISTPALPKGPYGIDAIVILAILLAVAAAILLRRTQWGLAIRAAGEYPSAVEAAGFNALRLRLGAMLVAAAFAGLAGGYLSLGIAGSFAESMTAGRGFVAIALVTFGRWKPLWVCAAALLVGAAEQAQFEMQARGIALPREFLVAMPYIAALAVLVMAGKGTLAPEALGRPFRRTK